MTDLHPESWTGETAPAGMTTYPDAIDGDALHVLPGNDGVLFQHQRAGVCHSVNLDRDTVAELVAELSAWLQREAPASCRWANQLCEQPNHHGCTDCPLVPAEPLTVTAEAEAAVYGDRQDDYGHPREDFTRTAVLWQGLLLHKLADGASIAPEDVARCMIGVKLARDVHAPKRDNRVDGAGYFLTLDRLETGR